jgi:hypothetical protein
VIRVRDPGTGERADLDSAAPTVDVPSFLDRGSEGLREGTTYAGQILFSWERAGSGQGKGWFTPKPVAERRIGEECMIQGDEANGECTWWLGMVEGPATE